MHALTEDQQQRLKDALASSSPFLAQFVTFGLHTGCRIGEIVGLRWQDVDEANRELLVARTLSAVTERRKTVPQRLGPVKSGKARRVHISSELLPVLRELRRQAIERSLRLGRPFAGADFVFA